MAKNKTEKIYPLSTEAEKDRFMRAVKKIDLTKGKVYSAMIWLGDENQKPKESRSSKQNRLSFLWYRILGETTGHGIEYERHYHKLTYGIPLLREDAAFNHFYQTALGHLSYEQRLMAMEYVPVTRLMTVKQFAQYLNTVDQESANKGIVLPQPEDLYMEALMKDAG